MKRITLFTIFAITSLAMLSQANQYRLYSYSSHFSPDLKIKDNVIYISHPTGLYCKDISNLNINDRKIWELFAFEGEAIDDFILGKDGNIIAATDNYYPAGEPFVLKDKTGTEEYIPETILDSYSKINNPQFGILKLEQSSQNENKIYAMTQDAIFISEDFGKTWETSNIQPPGQFITTVSIGVSPHDDNFIIHGFNSAFEENIFYYLNKDKKLSQVPFNFFNPTSIAFHPTDENIVVLAGWNIVMTSDKGETWEEMLPLEFESFGIDYVAFDLRDGNRLFGTSQGKGMMYSDDFGKTWNEYYPIPTENSKIADFEQYGSKLYILMADYTLYELDLELIDSAVEEVTEDSLSITISADTLQFSSASEITQVEIYRADGMLLHSAESNANDGNIDISTLSAGVHIAVFTTSDGQTISKKIITAGL